MSKRVSSIGKRQWRQAIAVVLLGSALILSGCGSRGDASEAGSGDSGAPAATAKPLPTMPAARFAAPTTMIGAPTEEAEVEATATLTSTEELSGTEDISATEEVTST